jgi:hypothetical protein
MTSGSLDINSIKGQTTLQQENRAVQLLLAHLPGYQYIPTSKNMPAIADAILTKDGSIASIVSIIEQKSRNLTINQLKQLGSTWLMTWEKLDNCRQIGQQLCIPFWGLLYLIPEDTALLIPISDNTGLLKRQVTIEATQTQATINGGQIIRNNAYIHIDDILNDPLLHMTGK